MDESSDRPWGEPPEFGEAQEVEHGEAQRVDGGVRAGDHEPGDQRDELGAAQAIAWFNSLTILAAQKKLIALS